MEVRIVKMTRYSGHMASAVAGAIALGVAFFSPSMLSAQTVARPEARVQTVPVPNDDDAADDPAVWIHPKDPGRSLVLGTNKAGGLHAYNMDGTEQHVVSEGVQPNNVDVLYNFRLDGRAGDIALASVRAKKSRGIKVWMIDAATRQLSDVTQGGIIQVFGGSEPYGACGYRSARTGRFYVFVSDERGRVEQHELKDAGDGRIGATKVRSFSVGSTVEGCVADPEMSVVYMAEEARGVWKFDAEPDGQGKGKLVIRVGENGLQADAEGVTLYPAADGHGYLIVSSQGNNTFKVYERGGDNAYVMTIDPKAGRFGDVSDTDGIVVTNCPTSNAFPRGLFIAQDGKNEGGNQNFKLFAWEDIAGTKLKIDTNCRVRNAAP
jgi:3-phytase